MPDATPKPPDPPPPHPLVEKLLGKGDPPKDHAILYGYFGPPKRAGYYRLYIDLNFRSYYDIPEKGFVYAEATQKTDPESPTRVYVTADTKVDFVQISTYLASYLQGAIAGGYLSAATAAGPHGMAFGVGIPYSNTAGALCSLSAHCCQGVPPAPQRAHPAPGPVPGVPHMSPYAATGLPCLHEITLVTDVRRPTAGLLCTYVLCVPLCLPGDPKDSPPPPK